MFHEDDASLTEVCCVVIHERFVQDEEIDRIYDGKSPKTREVRLSRYRTIIHNNLCMKDTWINLRLFVLAHRRVCGSKFFWDMTPCHWIICERLFEVTLFYRNVGNYLLTDADAHSRRARQHVDFSSVSKLSELHRLRIPEFKVLVSRVHLIGS